MFSGNSLMSVRDKLRYLKCFKLPMKSGTSLIFNPLKERTLKSGNRGSKSTRILLER
ncbi:hypothetical protein HanRHA438_Chr13g0628401 [Helianthus annuus]|nr:hypothetical protein HanRHA438_Chr13g0628401 [Helianthus annuus]